MVEEACEKLGYVFSHQRFAKAEDLEKQQSASHIDQICRKYGFGMDFSKEKTTEDLNLVRGAIKELFPRIPEKDLEQIVKHAWEAGTDRVGTAKDLSLARRVQLAVIARIRHTYTDYDILLRAFDWRTAREQVEPVTLSKLIEWRGENESGEDNELDEMVRETIVIDDEGDDDPANELEDLTDSFDDVSSEDSGRQSAYQTDAAGANGHSTRQPMLYRGAPQKDSIAQATEIARAKIAQARQWMQQPPAHDPSAPGSVNRHVYPAHPYPGPVPPPRAYPQPPATYSHAFPAGEPGYTDASYDSPDTIVVNGRIMRKVRRVTHHCGTLSLTHSQVLVAPQSARSLPHVYDQNNGTSYAGPQVIRVPTAAPRHTPPTQHIGHDHAIPSIEDDVSPRYDRSQYASQLKPMRRSGPNTPESFGAIKRKRADEDTELASPAYRSVHRDVFRGHDVGPVRVEGYQDGVRADGQPWQPPLQYATAQPREVRVVRLNTAHPSAPGSPRHDHSTFPFSDYRPQQHAPQPPAAYDPAHPGLIDERDMPDNRNPQQHAYPALLETRAAKMQNPAPLDGQRHDVQPLLWNGQSHQQQLTAGDARYISAAQRSEHPRPIPAPVHGAPAPVQTMPKETGYDLRLSGQQASLQYGAPEQGNINGAAYTPPKPAYAANNWTPNVASAYHPNPAPAPQYYPR